MRLPRATAVALVAFGIGLAGCGATATSDVEQHGAQHFTARQVISSCDAAYTGVNAATPSHLRLVVMTSNPLGGATAVLSVRGASGPFVQCQVGSAVSVGHVAGLHSPSRSLAPSTFFSGAPGLWIWAGYVEVMPSVTSIRLLVANGATDVSRVDDGYATFMTVQRHAFGPPYPRPPLTPGVVVGFDTHGNAVAWGALGSS
jgi:hypothetical protein